MATAGAAGKASNYKAFPRGGVIPGRPPARGYRDSPARSGLHGQLASRLSAGLRVRALALALGALMLPLGPSDARAQSQCELSPDANTVALWHFNEGQGQLALDSSGNGRDLTLGPTASPEAQDPVWIETPFGHGLYFTSSEEDYANGLDSNTFPTNELSIELWVQPLGGSGVDGYAQIFTAGFINCFVGINLGLDSGWVAIQGGVGDGYTWEIATAELGDIELHDGAWHYIAMTYDGAAIRIFLDGQEVHAEMDSSLQLAEPHDYKVGGRPYNTFLEGSMDEVRLSDVARSPQDIFTNWGIAQACIGVHPPPQARVEVLDSDQSSLTLRYEFPLVTFTEVVEGGQPFTRLRLAGVGGSGAPGRPDLPVLRRTTELPLGASVDVEVLDGSYQEILLSDLGLPAIRPVQLESSKTGPPPDFQYDAAYYDQNVLLPDKPVQLGEASQLRGHRLQAIEARPVAYNPATGTLRIYTDVTARVLFPGGDLAQSRTAWGRYTWLDFGPIRETLLGCLSCQYQPYTLYQPGCIGYVIILGDPSFREPMERFVTLKRWQGYRVLMYDLTDVSAFTTPQSPEEELQLKRDIRSFVKLKHYDNASLPASYLLLVGDSNTIPVWNCDEREVSTHSDHMENYHSVYPHVRTDLYYACMDDDIQPDLGIGRFPVRTAEHVVGIVDKYVEYDRLQGDEAWLRKIAYISDGEFPNYEHVQVAHDYLIDAYTIDQGYSGRWPLDPQPGGDLLYFYHEDDQVDAYRDLTVNMLKEGRWAVIYNGHGSVEYWWHKDEDGHTSIVFGSSAEVNVGDDFSSPDGWTEGIYPFVTAFACKSGRFSDPDVASLGEKWLLQEHKGAIAFLGATELSMWDKDPPLQKNIFASFFGQYPYAKPGARATLAGMISNGKHLSIGSDWGAGEWRESGAHDEPDTINQEMYNLLGDPSLKPWSPAWDIVVAGDFAGTAQDDLVFYSRKLGELVLGVSDNDLSFSETRRIAGVGNQWDAIVAGDFTSSYPSTGPGAELLFYSRSTGSAKLYGIAASSLVELQDLGNVGTGWDLLAAGRHAHGGATLFLVLYRDLGGGTAEADIYLAANDQLSLVQHVDGLTGGFDLLTSANFVADAEQSELFFYDRHTGNGAIYHVIVSGPFAGLYPLAVYPYFGTGWDLMAAGSFSFTGNQDVLFYDRHAGVTTAFNFDQGSGWSRIGYPPFTRTIGAGWDVLDIGSFFGNQRRSLFLYARDRREGLLGQLDYTGGILTKEGHAFEYVYTMNCVGQPVFNLEDLATYLGEELSYPLAATQRINAARTSLAATREWLDLGDEPKALGELRKAVKQLAKAADQGAQTAWSIDWLVEQSVGLVDEAMRKAQGQVALDDTKLEQARRQYQKAFARLTEGKHAQAVGCLKQAYVRAIQAAGTAGAEGLQGLLATWLEELDDLSNEEEIPTAAAKQIDKARSLVAQAKKKAGNGDEVNALKKIGQAIASLLGASDQGCDTEELISSLLDAVEQAVFARLNEAHGNASACSSLAGAWSQYQAGVAAAAALEYTAALASFHQALTQAEEAQSSCATP